MADQTAILRRGIGAAWRRAAPTAQASPTTRRGGLPDAGEDACKPPGKRTHGRGGHAVTRQCIARAGSRAGRVLGIASAALVLLLGSTAPAADGARMYQWRHPETGTVQLSGAAPSWYRAQASGPRVLVYAQGRILDDTARPVSEAERLALRAAALGVSEPPVLLDEPARPPAPAPATPPAVAAPPEPAALSADDIAHYKAVIEAWDRAERERAAAILGGPPPRQ